MNENMGGVRGFGLVMLVSFLLAMVMLSIACSGCGTARGLCHDISVITATMAEDVRVEQPSPYRGDRQ